MCDQLALPRRSSEGISVKNHITQEFVDSMRQSRVVVLGPAGVGKTAIIKQFATHTFPEEYYPTVRPVVHTQTVMLDNRVYQLKILDLPPLKSFPLDSLEEWNRGVSIRSASAYLLVYDASNLDSFQHVKALKEQIYESRDMHNVPVLIVANKFDLIASSQSTSSSSSSSTSNSAPQSSSSSLESRERRDICSMVRKQWKLSHMECSAKTNWRIIAIFKEITRLCDILETSHAKENIHLSHIENFHPLTREKCAIS